jgi:hypothetical protein
MNATCIELKKFKIKLEQNGFDNFTVVYFKQITRDLNYAQAAHELGECIMHALACEGRLDNREPGEE